MVLMNPKVQDATEAGADAGNAGGAVVDEKTVVTDSSSTSALTSTSTSTSESTTSTHNDEEAVLERLKHELEIEDENHPFAEEDSEDNIQYNLENDGTKTIRCATVHKLVEHLTNPQLIGILSSAHWTPDSESFLSL